MRKNLPLRSTLYNPRWTPTVLAKADIRSFCLADAIAETVDWMQDQEGAG